MKKNEKSYIGLDIGGTKTALGVFDKDMQLLKKLSYPTPSKASKEELASFFIKAVKDAELFSEKEGFKLSAVGVGVPAAINKNTSEILFTPNIPALTEINIRKLFEKELNILTVTDNDANCAALAEHRYGAGRDFENMAYITVSTGIGCGLILNDKLYRGVHGYAGEIGHVVLDMFSKRICGCKNAGCAEIFGAGSHLEETVKLAEKSGKTTVIKRPADGISLKEALLKGDELAKEIFDTVVNTAATLIYDLTVILDIDKFVVGGGFLNFGDAFTEGIKGAYKKRAHIGAQIVRAELKQDFGIIGAAQLLFE